MWGITSFGIDSWKQWIGDGKSGAHWSMILGGGFLLRELYFS